MLLIVVFHPLEIIHILMTLKPGKRFQYVNITDFQFSSYVEQIFSCGKTLQGCPIYIVVMSVCYRSFNFVTAIQLLTKYTRNSSGSSGIGSD